MITPSDSRACRSGIEPLEPRIAPATFTVLNLHDAGAGSLRDAVASANAAPFDDQIVFRDGLAGKITLATPINITDDVVIRGPATGAIKLSGNDATQIFLINDGLATERTVKLLNLGLRDGTAATGGAIRSLENLTLKNCLFRDNNATSFGGAVSLETSDATLVVINSVFVGNSSTTGDGGALIVFGNLNLHSSSFVENTCNVRGGAIMMFGAGLENKATIAGTSFTGNKAASTGGAIHLEGVESAAIRDCIISGNSTTGANMDGGGVHLANTFLSMARTTLDGNKATGDGGGLSIDSGSTALVSASVVKRNQAAFEGGGIVSDGALVVTGSKILKNEAGDSGGGIRTENTATGDFEITQSVIKGNTAVGRGGGLNLFNPGDKLIDHCVISGNTAGDRGGGLRAANDTLTVLATTIASNKAAIGGGVSVTENATPLIARFVDCFIINNIATTSGGGIAETTNIAPVLQNTRVTGNTAPVDPQTSGVFFVS